MRFLLRTVQHLERDSETPADRLRKQAGSGMVSGVSNPEEKPGSVKCSMLRQLEEICLLQKAFVLGIARVATSTT